MLWNYRFFYHCSFLFKNSLELSNIHQKEPFNDLITFGRRLPAQVILCRLFPTRKHNDRNTREFKWLETIDFYSPSDRFDIFSTSLEGAENQQNCEDHWVIKKRRKKTSDQFWWLSTWKKSRRKMFNAWAL